jgi:Fur family zinc uptake transcriptional regulator
MKILRAYQEHDHRHCVDEALAAAQSCCQKRGARLTKQRKEVLRLLWQSHKPLGAYEILEQLSKGNTERRIAPPTIYRALEFLQQNGLVHRIASLNAYIGCSYPETSHEGQFYICQDCHCTAEFADHPVTEAITHCADQAGFQVEKQAVEVFGLCPNCHYKQEANDDGAGQS